MDLHQIAPQQPSQHPADVKIDEIICGQKWFNDWRNNKFWNCIPLEFVCEVKFISKEKKLFLFYRNFLPSKLFSSTKIRDF